MTLPGGSDMRVLATQVDGIARRIVTPVDCEDRITLERAADRLRAFEVERREMLAQLATYGERLDELAEWRDGRLSLPRVGTP